MLYPTACGLAFLAAAVLLALRGERELAIKPTGGTMQEQHKASGGSRVG